MKLLKYLPLFLILFSLSACFQFEEVLQLSENGEILMDFQMKIPMEPGQGKKDKKPTPSDPTLKGLKEGLRQEEIAPLKLIKVKEESRDGYVWGGFTLSAPSLKDLKKFYQNFDLKSSPPKVPLGDEKPSNEKAGKDKVLEETLAKGDFKIQKLKNGHLLITRTFTPPPAQIEKKSAARQKNGKQEESAQNPEDGLMDIVSFRFEFISPTNVISTNAQQQYGRSLRWSTNLGYLTSKPFKMEMEIESNPALDRIAEAP